MNKHIALYLCIILLIGGFFRLFRLSETPPGINRDEASIGITAKSLLETGKDEYGKTLPISFESFGDWKLPLYIYATIPFVWKFGLTEISVRLLSAISGIFTIAATYFLTFTLFRSRFTALAAAFVLAVMPWHIHISRVESEAIVATLFITLSILMSFQGFTDKNPKKLLIGAILASLTLYTYHGTHISTPLLFLGIAISFRKEIIENISQYWKPAIVGFILSFIILSATGAGADTTKLSGISIFGDPTVVHTKIELPRLEHIPVTLTAKIIHNRITYAITTTYTNILRSFSPEFLFITGGGNNAHNIQGFGNLHPLEAVFLLIGISTLIMSITKKQSFMVIWWLCIAAIAPAITKDAPHSNRMLMVTPALAITIALGITHCISNAKKYWKWILVAGIAIAYITSIAVYSDTYFFHFPHNESQHWGVGYKTLAAILASDKYKEKKIIMANPEESPYAYLLFYTNYNMDSYQHEAKRYPITSDGFTHVSGFGRFTFRPIVWKEDIASDTAIITKPYDIPDSYKEFIQDTVRTPDGSIQFVVVTQ